MSAYDLVLVVAAVLCALGFTALVVVLVRVLDSLRTLRAEIDDLRAETRPMIDDLRESTEEAAATIATARADLDRFDRVLGSAEAIEAAVAGSGRVARTAFSAPLIKIAGLATGTSRAVRRLRTGPPVELTGVESRSITRRSSGRRASRRSAR